MYHIRSSSGARRRYREQEARAWRSLFCCTLAAAAILPLALLHRAGTAGNTPGNPSAAILWAQGDTAPHPRPQTALPPPPTPEPEIEPPTPSPVEHLCVDPCPATTLPPLAGLAETAGGAPLLPAPETLAPARPSVAQAAPARQRHRAQPQPASPAQGLAQSSPPACLRAPEPPYPPTLRAERAEGSVRVRIAVDALGNPTRVDILQGSGHREFDTTARDWILRHWRFSPARLGGKAIAGAVSTSIRFVID